MMDTILLFLSLLALVFLAFPVLATPITRTNLTNTLKEVYASDNMYKTFNRRHVGLAKIRRKPQSVDEGLQFRYNVHTAGTSAGAHLAENGALPDPKAQDNDWLIFNMKTYAHRIMLSGQVMWTTKGKRAALVKALNFQASNAVLDARWDFGYEFYVPAIGKMTLCQEVISNSPTAIIRVESVRRLRKAMRIQLLDTSGLAGTNGTTDATIRAIDARTKQITLENSSSAADITLGGTSWATVDSYGNSDHAIYLYDRPGAAVGSWGIEDLISDVNPENSSVVGNFGEVDRSASGNEWSKAGVINLKGNPLTNALADEACTMVEVEGQGNVDFWLTTHEIFRDILRFAEGDKRASMREKIGDTWFPRAFLAGKPVYPCQMCTPRMAYGIDRKAVWYPENKPLDWEDEDGAIMARVQDKWAYEALLTRMYQMCGIPNCHALIKNIASSTAVQ